MRIIISTFFILFFCLPSLATDYQIPEPYSTSNLIAYSEIKPEVAEKLSLVKDIYIKCEACDLCKYLEKHLLEMDYRVRNGLQPTKVNIVIKKSNEKYWEFVRSYISGDYDFHGTIRPISGPTTDLYYKECIYSVTMNIPGMDESIFEQETKTILHVQPDTAKPADIPNEEELSTELLPLITGLLGNFDMLEKMLNADKSIVRKQAVEHLCALGNPKAVDILEKRLKNEKNRSVKSRIKKAVKSFK